MDRTKLLLVYSLSLAIITPVLFPQLTFFFFAPFLVITYYKKPLITCLWLSLFCGLFIDLLSSQTRLGLHALNYCIVTKILYSRKFLLFEDSISTIPLNTFFFAVLSTLIQVCLLNAFGKDIVISWQWIKSDLFWMSLWNACYAIVAFSIPSFFLPKPPHKRTRLFSLKENTDA